MKCAARNPDITSDDLRFGHLKEGDASIFDQARFWDLLLSKRLAETESTELNYLPNMAGLDENMGIELWIIAENDSESQKALYAADQNGPDTMFIDNEDFIKLCPASDSSMGPYVI